MVIEERYRIKTGNNYMGTIFFRAKVHIFETDAFKTDFAQLWADFELLDKEDTEWWEAFKDTVRD